MGVKNKDGETCGDVARAERILMCLVDAELLEAKLRREGVEVLFTDFETIELVVARARQIAPAFTSECIKALIDQGRWPGVESKWTDSTESRALSLVAQ